MRLPDTVVAGVGVVRVGDTVVVVEGVRSTEGVSQGEARELRVLVAVRVGYLSHWWWGVLEGVPVGVPIKEVEVMG